MARKMAAWPWEAILIVTGFLQKNSCYLKNDGDITCHLADAFIQSDLQLIRLSRRHTPPGAMWG